MMPILDEDGDVLELGQAPRARDAYGNARCCAAARLITNHQGDGPFSSNPGKYTCVCEGRSYCPEHGIRCNGSHD